MSTATLVSVEKYLRLTDKPYREYRDGVLFTKALATSLHGLLEFVLMTALRKLGLKTAAEVTVRLSATKYLVPDVIAAHVIENPYPTKPVLLCCEILSPEDRLGAMLAKCEEYQAWGVPFCWVIDPVKETTWEYHSGAEPLRVTEKLTAGEYSVSLQELFAELANAS